MRRHGLERRMPWRISQTQTAYLRNLAGQHVETNLPNGTANKAQGNGQRIAHHRQPAEQGGSAAVAVRPCLHPGNLVTIAGKELLHPRPFTDIAQEVGRHAAQRIAGGRHQHARDRVESADHHGGEHGLRTQGQDRRRQK